MSVCGVMAPDILNWTEIHVKLSRSEKMQTASVSTHVIRD
jgi:hypothetical protein